MKNVALITGASSGIGRELAKIHAQSGGDLVIVARRIELLNELKLELTKEFGIEIEVLQQDLTQKNAAQTIFKFTQEKNIKIAYLINNAGFGGHGLFIDRPIEKDIEMIQLNVLALVEITHLYLQEMRKNNFGKILNLASTAGFFPGPLQATYFATKAFVISFTRGLAQELKSTNITITALCPGPVKTEFSQVAGMENTKLFEHGVTAYKTAKKGYQAMMKGKIIYISQASLNFGIRFIVPFLPNSILAKIIEKAQA
jgi:short-subunit dehydrogenase